jgi:hypothetical protein
LNVANEQNKRRAKCNQKSSKTSDARATVTALRVMRPPQAVRVEMRNEQPGRVYLHGMRGEVIAASGLWRSSGDWWQEDAWHQDEWDLEIEFVPTRQNVNPIDFSQLQSASGNNRDHIDKKPEHSGPQRGLYRIYYDALKQGWFLRGVYD